MANGKITCPVCAFELTAGTRFCGECGSVVPEELAQGRSKPAPTILGIDAEAVRLAAAAAQAAAGDTSQYKDGPSASESGTHVEEPKLAAPSQRGSSRLAGQLESHGSEAAPASRATSSLKDAASALPTAELAAGGGGSSESTDAADKRFNRTRLEGAPHATSSTPPNLEARAAAVSARNWAQRTSLGWGDKPLSSAPPSKLMHGRTMLGVPLAAISPSLAPHLRDAPSASSAAGAIQVSRAATASEAASDVAATPESSGTRPMLEVDPQPSAAASAAPSVVGTRARLGGFIVCIGVIALATVLYLRMTAHPKGVDVRAHITTNEQGESLQFDVPAAVPGALLRFGGQEQPITAGHATFPLASDSLRVGDNVVLAEVVEPSGEHTSARIVIALAYRIWVDTSALQSARPSVDVKVAALPGTRVLLDDEALALETRDGQAHGEKTYPLEPPPGGKGGVIDHVVSYRVEPPNGEPVTDQLHTRVPVATLQIDRPGPDLITDSDTIEIAGSVGRDTAVSVDGRQVPVKEGHFVQRLSLPKPGEYKPRVTAGGEGKLPVSATLTIRRVRDLTQATREFSFDKSLSYAKIAAAPNNFRGQPIAIEGRVYAVDARAGTSVVQMLARPCPSGQRCSLWVVDPQAREVPTERWVRVLGVVDGEQQFRSENNQIVTVPKVIAQFILPARP